MLNLSWRIWAPRTAASFSTVADLRWIKPRSNDICILNQFKKICMCIHIYIYTNIICIITHISFSFFLHACLQSDMWFVENISMIIIKHALTPVRVLSTWARCLGLWIKSAFHISKGRMGLFLVFSHQPANCSTSTSQAHLAVGHVATPSHEHRHHYRHHDHHHNHRQDRVCAICNRSQVTFRQGPEV